MPVVSPTVPNAGGRLEQGAIEIGVARRLDRHAPGDDAPIEIAAMATARRWVRSGSRRRWACTSASPRTSDQIISAITAKVVTLMPPAVPALPPPTNISIDMSSQLTESIAPMSIELNPAVRVCTDWNAAASTFCGVDIGPSVPPLVHSPARMTPVPSTNNAAVVIKVIRVCRLSLGRDRRQRIATADRSP